MDRIRDICNATVIAHGANPETFTIEREIFIPIDMGLDIEEPEMRAGLMKYLAEWYKPNGYFRYPRCYPRPDKKCEKTSPDRQ